MLYKRVVCVLYFSCCVFSKERNQLITGKIKLEEQCESAQEKKLKLTGSQYALLLDNVSLNNNITLTIQNIDVTQESTAQLKADKK